MNQPKPANTRSTIIPCMRYRNAPEAIQWLRKTFGFEELFSASEQDGTLAHAQLGFGNGMVMIGSVRKSPLNNLMRQPDEISGACTQSAYVIVKDVEALFEKVRTAKAEILVPIQKDTYGGSSFVCRDVEGHIWTFGTYDPWSPAGTQL